VRGSVLLPSRSVVSLALVLATSGLAFPQGAPVPPLAEELPTLQPLRERLRHRLETAAESGGLTVDGEVIHAPEALFSFYERRLFEPAWIDPGCCPTPTAWALVEEIIRAREEGLDPGDYHLDSLEELLSAHALGQIPPGPGVDLDLLLTDAFLALAVHRLAGRLDPETLDPEWVAMRRERDLVALLEEALPGGQIGAALARLDSVDPAFARLREALTLYRQLAADGGWTPVPEPPPGEKLEEGFRGREVAMLRRRLAVTGELARGETGRADPAADELFDAEVAAAVRTFQGRHGLDPDGKVGKKTLAELNVPAAWRVRQIELNLERWRWLPQDLGERHILVNIPRFELDVWEGREIVLSMRVVVGKTFRRTPVMSEKMRYLVLNPSWEVPRRLVVEDKLPLIRKNIAYLAEQGIRVLSGWGAEQQEIDPETVDWSSLGRNNFPYRLRQDPGPKNALGRVKFMFPNRFDVYLHDTPSRELFGRTDRDFSSGCVRIEKPLELAEYLLREAPGWDRSRIDGVIASGKETTVSLPGAVPVHLLYWTAWAEADGTVHFRRDLYGRDDRLAAALDHRNPGPSAPPSSDLRGDSALEPPLPSAAHHRRPRSLPMDPTGPRHGLRRGQGRFRGAGSP